MFHATRILKLCLQLWVPADIVSLRKLMYFFLLGVGYVTDRNVTILLMTELKHTASSSGWGNPLLFPGDPYHPYHKLFKLSYVQSGTVYFNEACWTRDSYSSSLNGWPNWRISIFVFLLRVFYWSIFYQLKRNVCFVNFDEFSTGNASSSFHVSRRISSVASDQRKY